MQYHRLADLIKFACGLCIPVELVERRSALAAKAALPTAFRHEVWQKALGAHSAAICGPFVRCSPSDFGAVRGGMLESSVWVGLTQN